jgi:hypothetical protein
MRNILGFFCNFLLATIFAWDIMDYYFFDGINVINNEVNRIFIMWVGFLTSFFSGVSFLNQQLKKR